MEMKQIYIFFGVIAKCFDEHNRLLSVPVRLHEHVSLSDHFLCCIVYMLKTEE